MSNILRDMRKGKKANASKNLNTSMYANPGGVMSHVAQGVLRDSRKVLQDHVIWKQKEDRSKVDGGTNSSGGSNFSS